MTKLPTIADLPEMEAGAGMDAAAEFVVFDDDLQLRNDADIVTFLVSVWETLLCDCLDLTPGYETEFYAWRRTEDANGSDGLHDVERWMWQTRDVGGVRKPYADALEKAVAEHRRKPRPFSTDPSAGVFIIEAMRAQGAFFHLEDYFQYYKIALPLDGYVGELGDIRMRGETLALAGTRAAIASKLLQKEQGQ